jgi:glycosyltransferase involved in cell wall biosynthesis
MELIVVLEGRFERTRDGSVWTQWPFDYTFWTRYLAAFDRVRVVARVLDVEAASERWKRVDGERVTVVGVPSFVGPLQYALRRGAVVRSVREAVRPTNAVLLRVSSQLALLLEPMLRRTGRPYAVEVVGDPYDAFAPGAARHPLRRFFRVWYAWRLRRLCAHAAAAAYVTSSTLQRRYPPAPAAHSTHYSSITLPRSAFACAPRRADRPTTTRTLVFVGSLEQLYKGADVLLEALAVCVAQGLDLRAILVGDGRYRAELVQRCAALGLTDRVDFRGQLPAGEAVLTTLDEAELFVLPSRQEGLPRAMIEAMARGLPCIGSTAGGIPELLPAEDVVPVSDAAALAAKIREVVTDPERMARMSARNLARAADYRDDVLSERRTAFYRVLRDQTEAWLNARDGR